MNGAETDDLRTARIADTDLAEAFGNNVASSSHRTRSDTYIIQPIEVPLAFAQVYSRVERSHPTDRQSCATTMLSANQVETPDVDIDNYSSSLSGLKPPKRAADEHRLVCENSIGELTVQNEVSQTTLPSAWCQKGSSRSIHRDDNNCTAVLSVADLQTDGTPAGEGKPSFVRKVKSYGDLLSVKHARRSPSPSHSRRTMESASMIKSRSANGTRESDSQHDCASFGPDRSVRQRTSTAMQRCSSAHTLKFSQHTVEPSADLVEVPSRNFTSPAAPGRTDLDANQQSHLLPVALQERRRRGSSFFGVPAFLKGKGKETIPSLPILPSSTAMQMNSGATLVDSPITTVSEVKRLQPPTDEVYLSPATPPPEKAQKRFSFLPPFFRSASSSSQYVVPQAVIEVNAPAPFDSDLEKQVPNLMEPSVPISIPRLPDITLYKDDLSASMSSMFEFGTRRKARSRASTRDTSGITSGLGNANYSGTEHGDASQHVRHRSISTSPSEIRCGHHPPMLRLATLSSPASPSTHSFDTLQRIYVQSKSHNTPEPGQRSHSPSMLMEGSHIRLESLLQNPRMSGAVAWDSAPPSPSVRFTTDANGISRSDSSSSEHPLSNGPGDLAHSLIDRGASGTKAITLLRLRRRANTAGSMTSEAASVTPVDSQSDAASLGQSIRSASSSRLSSMFSSSSSFRTALGSPVSFRDVDHTLRASPPTLSSETPPPSASDDRYGAFPSPSFAARSPTILSPLSVPPLFKPTAGVGAKRSDVRIAAAPNALPDARETAHSCADPGPVLQALEDEEPHTYLARLTAAMPFSEIGTVLAAKSATRQLRSQKADCFLRRSNSVYTSCLQLYMTRFELDHCPIDVALRKLLYRMRLPNETQQIDRVMEAFAAAYNHSNPDIFCNPDHPYILAFSMIMLHTDHFNKANKRKMSRADYMRNTKIDGIQQEILGYLYDNITYTPFVYAEDLDGLGERRGRTSDSPVHGSATSPAAWMDSSRGNIYQVISSVDQLADYRLDLSAIPTKNPYTYSGTAPFFDCTALRKRVDETRCIEIVAATCASGSESPKQAELVPVSAITASVMFRKDDIAETGRKATTRKWSSQGVVLCNQRLLFYRDRASILAIQRQPAVSAERSTTPLVLPTPPSSVSSLSRAVALYDFNYRKYENVFRLVLDSGRQILFQASSENNMNDWIASINYAAAFCSAGLDATPPSQSFCNRVSQETFRVDSEALGSDLPIEVGRLRTIAYTKGDVLSGTLPNHGAHFAINSPAHVRTLPQGRGEVDRHSPADEVHVNAKRLDTSERQAALQAAIANLDASIEILRGQLKEAMKVLKGLAILTPFTNSSRTRLQQAILPHGNHIASIRQSIVREIKTLGRSKAEQSQRKANSHIMRRGVSHDGPEAAQFPYGQLQRCLTSSEASLAPS